MKQTQNSANWSIYGIEGFVLQGLLLVAILAVPACVRSPVKEATIRSTDFQVREIISEVEGLEKKGLRARLNPVSEGL